MKCYRIGRGQACDIRFDDKAVSRRHAEIVITAKRTLFVTDCQSTHGTFVYRNNAWASVRQAFIEPHERLKFGTLEITASELVRS